MMIVDKVGGHKEDRRTAVAFENRAGGRKALHKAVVEGDQPAVERSFLSLKPPRAQVFVAQESMTPRDIAHVGFELSRGFISIVLDMRKVLVAHHMIEKGEHILREDSAPKRYGDGFERISNNLFHGARLMGRDQIRVSNGKS